MDWALYLKMKAADFVIGLIAVAALALALWADWKSRKLARRIGK